ncbi:hypothetical protein SAMN05444397_105177 [Flavobacterium aquidurense]|uniref:Uncharacterized protein n=1 Tax=Flavobacterium frigidimaris TaxID=262320 RepID=A0ABX4BQP0_FLAFR|nr:hypothetical protein [Flavobacterium frigidimaris]OXA79378.1 hypothetical protein B0A65_10510 [Flavobacterium frigidimaris]SDZ32175.1 hypothetical protein SAMN05444397_105177 [Flavobacterium aquidurense]
MRKIIYVIFIALCIQNISGQDLKPAYQKFVKSFIANVKSNNKEGVSALISFPLGREYPIPAVKNKADFIKRYDQIFDATLKSEIIKSNPAKDWTEMGYQGIMLAQGDIWMDTTGKIITINYQSQAEKDLKTKLIASEKGKLHPSIATFKAPVYVLETSKFRIRIDDLGNDKYRYASWSVKKPMSEKPDLILTNGKWISDGSGGNSHYEFKKDTYLYECYIIVIGTSDSPPAYLSISQNGKEILNQNAKIVTK